MGASAPIGAFKSVGAPMSSKTLTDVAARAAKPREKPYKLAAGGGLYLEVMPSGARYWRLKHRFAAREKRLAMGVYHGGLDRGGNRYRADFIACTLLWPLPPNLSR